MELLLINNNIYSIQYHELTHTLTYTSIKTDEFLLVYIFYC